MLKRIRATQKALQTQRNMVGVLLLYNTAGFLYLYWRSLPPVHDGIRSMEAICWRGTCSVICNDNGNRMVERYAPAGKQRVCGSLSSIASGFHCWPICLAIFGWQRWSEEKLSVGGMSGTTSIRKIIMTLLMTIAPALHHCPCKYVGNALPTTR